MSVAAFSFDPAELTVPHVRGALAVRRMMSAVAARVLAQSRAALASVPRSDASGVWHDARRVATECLQTDDATVRASVLRTLCSPEMGVLLDRCERSRVDFPDAAAPRNAVCIALLTDLAARESCIPREVHFPRPHGGWPDWISPHARWAWTGSCEADLITVGPGRLKLQCGDRVIDVSLPLAEGAIDDVETTRFVASSELVHGVRLARADMNPDVAVPLHPERPGNALDFGGRPVAEWQAALRDALNVVHEFLPEVGDEMRVLLRSLVPVGVHEERHFSCSYVNALGAIYLSLHPKVMTLAEAIVHEFQHNKLHALLRLDPVLRNDEGARFRSPLRPDARPLMGVLMAVHAYVPIALMMRRMTESGHVLARSHDWSARRAQIDSVNREGLATVEAHARPTSAGANLLLGLRRELLREAP